MTILKSLMYLLLMFGDDLLVLIGLGFIVYASFLINLIAGMYVIGFISILLAYIFAKNVPKPDKRR